MIVNVIFASIYLFNSFMKCIQPYLKMHTKFPLIDPR